MHMVLIFFLAHIALTIAWFPRELGIFVHPSLKLQEDGHNGIRGLFTDVALDEDDLLCEIPLDSTLSCYSFLNANGDTEEDIPWPIELSLKIVTEMRKGPDSPFHEYFTMLPSHDEFKSFLPVYWSVTDDDGLGLMLEDQAQYVSYPDYNCDLLLEEIQRSQLWRKDIYDNFIPSLQSNTKYAHLVPPNLERDEFLYALDNALTRNCAVIDPGSEEKSRRPRRMHLMAPVFDMFNHAFNETAVFSLNSESNKLEVAVKEGHTVQRGEEVRINYRESGLFKDSLLEAQEYFWAHYGFVPIVYSTYITLPPSVTSTVLIEELNSDSGVSDTITTSFLLKQRQIAISDSFELCPSTLQSSDLMRALLVYCASPEHRKALNLTTRDDDKGIEGDISVLDTQTMKKAKDILVSLLQEMQEVLVSALELCVDDTEEKAHPVAQARGKFRQQKWEIINEALKMLQS